MFPTHVGIARQRVQVAALDLDVPYACGDCADMFLSLVTAIPCSLRMWGLRGATGAA